MMLRIVTAAAVLSIHLVGCTEPEHLKEGTIRQSVVSDCPFSQPTVPIDPSREMLIRSRAVVDDPCRTTWNTDCPAETRGKWTFGRLMTVMSGATDETSVVARQFVGRWLNFWLHDQTIPEDNVPVRARGNIRAALLDRWLADSHCPIGTDPAICPLDLKAAPFRLLAIVNRIDMAGGLDTATGGPSPGELRFVFGAYNKTSPSLDPVLATVILEYRFPSTYTSLQWATLLHGLSAVDLPASPATGTDTTLFASQLQLITNLVVEPNAQAGNPSNGSTIAHVRTSEIAFDPTPDPDAQWEFRQFGLSCACILCQLIQTPVSQTPPTRANPTPDIPINSVSDFIVAHQVEILALRHIVPTSMLGGSSLSPSPDSTDPVIWAAAPNPLPVPDPMALSPSDYDAALRFRALVRHNFAISTCNGCHGIETNNTNQLFHIAPRGATTTSTLSSFVGLLSPLQSDDGHQATNSVAVTDPASTFDGLGSPIEFLYNEPWRRSCEIRRILDGGTVAFTAATGHN
ncbi:MAG: hypothetical protein E6J90_13155 [Deltaproteobacteria bacterium]|nr:MAG: hypothetical protein E6J90_13155 [Deltaproteobacteria bacterium]